MSEPTSKVRWPWLLLAVLGLGGALYLPLMQSAKQSRPSVPSEGARAPDLLLRPAQRSTSEASGKLGQRGPASVEDSDPSKPSGPEDEKLKSGRLGLGLGHGHGGHRDPKPAGPNQGVVAAGPLGPPAGRKDPTVTDQRTDGPDEHAPQGPSPTEPRLATQLPSTAPKTDKPSDGAATPATTPDQLRQQLPGRFALSAPSEMQVGRSEHVTVVAAVEQLRAMVASDLQAVTGGATGQTVSTKDLPLSRLLRVELRADSDADFEIRSFTQADQRLSTEQSTTWEWSVTPKTDGDKNLTVVISNLVDGQGLPIAVTIAHRTLHVSLSLTQRVRELAGTATSAGSALAGLVGTWLGLLKPLLQRRREEDTRAVAKTEPEAKSSDQPKPPSDKPATTPPAAAKSDADPQA